jgi:hypothetical protein
MLAFPDLCPVSCFSRFEPCNHKDVVEEWPSMSYSSWSQAVRCSLVFCRVLAASVLPVGAMVADPSGAVVAANSDKAATAAIPQTIVVDASPTHVANTFSPVRSLGAAIDRLRTGAPDHLLNDPLLKEILGAGWQTVTYRQNTELMVEAWHWNPQGTWSDKEKQQGYFVGNAEPTAEMIRHSWAAPLPHRGFSRGDGNGWSRLTDGDLKSYWKSNPYLTKAFTGEDDS